MAARPRLGARAANALQASMEWPEDPGFPPCFNTQVADATFPYGAHRSRDVLFFSETKLKVSLGLMQQGRIFHAVWPRCLCTPRSVSSSGGS